MGTIVSYKLGEIATFVNGRAYSMPEMLKEGKYRLVRVGNFTGKDEWYYSDLELEDDKYCENGDLLYKWACTFGPEIWTGEKVIYHYHIWKVIPDPNKVDKDYLYYLLKYMTSKWMNAAHGSTMIHITKEIMEGNIVTVPRSVSEQHDIAMRLKAIDSKIKTNCAICSELEAMAKLLYDYWFVQFDFPDENGKPYKSSGGKMVWNEELKREIPEEWEVKRLGDFDTRVGGTPSRKEKSYWENGNIPWITTGEINNSVIVACNECITASGMQHSSAKEIPAGTVIIAMYGSGTAGRVGFLPYKATTNQACCAIVCKNEYDSAFVYFYCKSMWDYVNSIITGSIQQNLNKDTIDSFAFAYPPTVVLQSSQLNMIVAKLVELTEENQLLATLRDFLLPMLMNGQVKILPQKKEA